MSTERNLGAEFDEFKEKVDQVVNAQARIEDTLDTVKDALRALLTERAPPHHNVQQPFVIPIGEGYQPLHEEELAFPFGGEASAGEKNPDPKSKEIEDWKEKMEEKIRDIQGVTTYGSLDIEGLFPSAGVAVPKDFKVPEFNKYDGSTNPRMHLKSYVAKMAIWSKDEKFLVAFFQESLTGPALEWYTLLDHSKVASWKDLTNIFMGQYGFNMDMAPTREQLSSLTKKSGEAFRQYAQRWRLLAAQVQPSLTPSEMSSYFLGTLDTPYVSAMVGVTYKDFTDLVAAGERIELMLKLGKLTTGGEGIQKKGFMAKTGEVNQIQGTRRHIKPQYSSNYHTPIATFQQTSNTYPSYSYAHPKHPQQASPILPVPVNNILTPPQRPTYNRTCQNRPNYAQNFPPFPKLAITNAELFQRLSDARLMAGTPVRPFEPPFPAWYNPSLSCAYHMNVAGHSIESCEGFKTAVRRLMSCGKIGFEEDKGPNIIDNSIPTHGGDNGINMIDLANGEAGPMLNVISKK